MSNINYSGENSLTKLIELTKGSLSNKQDKLTAGTGITITNNVISATGSSGLFICTYGTTTRAALENAITNGLVPVCIYNNRVYVYSGKITVLTITHYFTSLQGSTNYYLTCTSTKTWSNGSTALATTTNLNTKQNKLTAGTNITIDSNNVISAASGGMEVTHTSTGFVDVTLDDEAQSVVRVNYKFVEINEGLIYFYYTAVLPDINGKHVGSNTSSIAIPAWAIPTDNSVPLITDMTPLPAYVTALTTNENAGWLLVRLPFTDASNYPKFIINKNAWAIPEGGTTEDMRTYSGMLSYYTI